VRSWDGDGDTKSTHDSHHQSSPAGNSILQAFMPDGFNVPFRNARRFMMKKMTGVMKPSGTQGHHH